MDQDQGLLQNLAPSIHIGIDYVEFRNSGIEGFRNSYSRLARGSEVKNVSSGFYHL